MSAQVFSQINMTKAVKTAVLCTVLLHLPSQFIRSGKRFDSDPRVWSPNHYCTRNLLYVLPWPVSHFSLHDVDLQSNNAINVNDRLFFHELLWHHRTQIHIRSITVLHQLQSFLTLVMTMQDRYRPNSRITELPYSLHEFMSWFGQNELNYSCEKCIL